MKLIGRTGDVIGRDAAIGDLLRIGTAADNEFRIAATGVSRHHARIVRQNPDEYWLEDSGSTNGTFVNGLRVARERLRHLDVVTLGRYVDLIAVASEQAQPPAAQTIRDAWLEALDGGAVGTRIDVPPGEVTLGRTAPSNVLLDSPLVSHLHARIERGPERVVLSDLGSSNGTFVNGRLMQEPLELADSDTISIAGSRYFRVHIVGGGGGGAPQPKTAATRTDVFASEWKTRLVWSADELVELEAERQRILFAVRREPALAAAAHKSAATPQAARSAMPTPEAPKPAPPKPTPPPAPSKQEAAPSPPQPPVSAPRPTPAAPKPAAQPPAASAGPAGDIRLLKLVGASATFKLGPGRHDVGRSDSIALTLFSRQVSRLHAVLIVTPTEVRVEDHRSANGTIVNGAKLPIGGSATLKHGDRVAFGDVEFTVELLS